MNMAETLKQLNFRKLTQSNKSGSWFCYKIQLSNGELMYNFNNRGGFIYIAMLISDSGTASICVPVKLESEQDIKNFITYLS